MASWWSSARWTLTVTLVPELAASASSLRRRPNNQSLSMSAVNGQTQLANDAPRRLSVLTLMAKYGCPGSMLQLCRCKTPSPDTVDSRVSINAPLASNGNFTLQGGQQELQFHHIGATTGINEFSKCSAIGANQFIIVTVSQRYWQHRTQKVAITTANRTKSERGTRYQ